MSQECDITRVSQAYISTRQLCVVTDCHTRLDLNRVKVYRVQLPDKNAYYELQDEAEQSRAQKFRDKQCESKS